MAKAFECEKCKKVFKGSPVAIFTLVAPDDSFYMKNLKIPEVVQGELCVDCTHELTGTKRRD